MAVIRDTKILFDKSSIHATEYSLRFFSFRHQVTIQAVGLHPEDVITFEVVHLESGTPDELHGCFIKPGELPRIAGVETLLCFGCDEGEEGEAPVEVRLTANNPVVILNAPQNVILRAKYDGPGIGTSQVWATIETDTESLLPGQDGCPGVCCEHDPESWAETGQRRCNLEEDKLEALMVDNCGVTEWQEIGDLNWVDTGDIRCVVAVIEGDDEEVEIVEKQQVNDCGDHRWVFSDEQTWIPTGEIECRDFDTHIPADADEEESRDGTLWRKEVNDCGMTRWVEVEPLTWTPTGLLQCVDHVEQAQEVNQCGLTRWVDTGDSCDWIATYRLPCGGLAFRPEDDRDPDADVELTTCDDEVLVYLYPEPKPWASWPVTDCGDCGEGEVLGYALNDDNPAGGFIKGKLGCDPCAGDPASWADTGLRRNVGDVSTDGYLVERQQVNGCGHFQWVEDTPETWQDTGVIQQRGDDIFKQQVDLNGNFRWVLDEPVEWVETGLTKVDEDKLWVQEVNQTGALRWVEKDDVLWVDTGETRCVEHEIQVRQTNQVGEVRWLETEEICGYTCIATYKLPSGGLAYDPALPRDPRATESLEDCEDNVLAYIYPTPFPGVTTEVRAGCGCDEESEVLGYAVNECESCKDCQDHSGT